MHLLVAVFLARTQFDPFSDFEEKITNVANSGEIIAFGDFNSRTGSKLDYLENENNHEIPLPDNYLTDTVATYPRGNLDTVTNMYGELLISLCRSVPLRICNGRKLGDTLGSYTCYKWNGNSTVDYCLASPGVYNKISSFQVDTWLPHLSDHCPILICLKTDIDLLFLEENDCEFNAKSLKIEWDKNIRDRFENIIQSYDSKVILSNFALQDIASNQESVDSATELLIFW